MALLWTALVGVVNLTFTVIAIWTVDKIRPQAADDRWRHGHGSFTDGAGAFVLYPFDWWMGVGVRTGLYRLLASSVGPVTWVILTEIFPTKIRGRANGDRYRCLWMASWSSRKLSP